MNRWRLYREVDGAEPWKPRSYIFWDAVSISMSGLET